MKRHLKTTPLKPADYIRREQWRRYQLWQAELIKKVGVKRAKEIRSLLK